MTLSVAQMRPPSPWGKTAVQSNDREGHYFLLLVVHPVCFLIGGLAGQIHAKLLHGVHIHAGQDDGSGLIMLGQRDTIPITELTGQGKFIQLQMRVC